MTDEHAELIEVTAKNLINKPNQFQLAEQNLDRAIAVETAKYLRAINIKLNWLMFLIILGAILAILHL